MSDDPIVYLVVKDGEIQWSEEIAWSIDECYELYPEYTWIRHKLKAEVY